MTEQQVTEPRAAQWLVVGTRADGSRVVLRECRGLGRAFRYCDRFRALLEGYALIDVEPIRDWETEERL